MELEMLKLIREHLGLEIGEKFKLRNSATGQITTNLQHEEVVYHFEENALCVGEDMRVAEYIFDAIIYGWVQIVKMPFEPKLYDKYWTYLDNDWSVKRCTWFDLPSDFVMFKAGMIFRTEQEAVEARPELYKEYTGKEWNDGKETN